MIDFKLVAAVISASLDAGRAILDVYRSEIDVHYKSDQSPLTEADRKSHCIIRDRLAPLGLPLLSEEGKDIPYPERKKWDRFWLVDPLDGTKEFIKRNDEFTVNIALIEKGVPSMGVVYAPATGALYCAESPRKAWKIHFPAPPTSADVSVESLKVNALPLLLSKTQPAARNSASPPATTAHSRLRPYTIVGSRSHAGKHLQAFIDEKKKEYADVAVLSAGSSLKFCLVAEGSADVYPRLGPTMEWDTGAGQAVASAAGARVVDYETGQRLQYNKADLHNPWFIVEPEDASP